jgi:Bacterial Ig-like domain
VDSAISPASWASVGGIRKAPGRLPGAWFWAIVLATAVGCGSGSGTALPVPAVVSTTPADNAAGVNLGVVLSATFNQQMNLSTINTATFVLSDPSGTLVSGAVAYDSVKFVATFTPDAPLTPNTTYMAGISSGVANAANTPLPADFTWSFTTGTIP